jgi:hypothetical protein
MQYAFHLAEGSILGEYMDAHYGLADLEIKA